MNNEYPYNRLQEWRQKHFDRVLFLAIVPILVLTAIIFLSPRPAFATEYWNPGNAPNVEDTPPSVVFWTAGFDHAEHQNAVMFRGKISIGSGNYWTGVTCTIAYSNNADINVYLARHTGSNFSTASDANNISFLDDTSANGTNRFWCWDGSVWSQTYNATTITTTNVSIDDTTGQNFSNLVHFVKYTGTWEPFVGLSGTSGGNFPHDFNCYYNLGYIADNSTSLLTIVGGSCVPSFTLNASSTSISKNEDVTFTATWAYLPANLRFLLFFPQGFFNANGTPSTNRVAIFGQAQTGSIIGSGTSVFHYSQYALPGSFSGTIVGSTDCNLPGYLIDPAFSGCTLYTDAKTIHVATISDEDTTGHFLFHPGSASGIYTLQQNFTDTPYEFYYHTTTEACLNSTISGLRMFRGYPLGQENLDPGVAVVGNTGTGSMSFIVPGTMHPHLHVYCSDTSSKDIYYLDTVYALRAADFNVYDHATNPYLGVDMNYGGFSTDYNAATGSGAYFFTNKQKYKPGEEVKLKFYYNVTFVPNEIVFYNDYRTGSGTTFVFTGSLLTNAEEHNFSLFYISSGTKYPVIQVRSSGFVGNPTIAGNANAADTYRNIYRGGNTTVDSKKYLTITLPSLEQLINVIISGNANALLDGSGSFIALQDGIFGLDPSTFNISFGNTDNLLLKFAADAVNFIVHAALEVSILAWHVLKNSPMFNTLDQVIHPRAGVTQTLPTSAFGKNLTWAESTFTVSYLPENSLTAKIASFFLDIAIFMGFVKLCFNAIFT